MILLVGLGIIVIAAVVARFQERPSSGLRGPGRKSGIMPETDLQVEGLARSGELPAAIAMYGRVHRVDLKRARRAVAGLAEGRMSMPAQGLSPKSKIGQLMLNHVARMKDSNL